ncbi:TetR/AcrR family transcriptional regulator [Actinomadura barringtoniae]|uniref:TetR/AcrR family transcriptional regulator n=1 Tax=Actinomadura barringtoniae TaxID=1427535 RepID=A0A939PE29_9ACTN|nr:TetR/AcrR family transcriptional regulator [Actinomadura barringtoniae]MBO2451137.1 TetR/AcrR family transcriptional regulator [Actinomadura barringtoniae]
MGDLRPSRAEQRRNTEARILEQARRLFAESGYDRTTIRAVATAANVDPGLVMHYFGSKERLFAQAAGSPAPPLTAGTAEEVAEQLLERLYGSLADQPVESLAVLRSMLTHPEAAREVHTSSRMHKEALSRAIAEAAEASEDADAGGADAGEDADLRADVVSAVLIGVAVGRHLIRLDHLAAADPERVVELMRPVIRSLTRADDEDRAASED